MEAEKFRQAVEFKDVCDFLPLGRRFRYYVGYYCFGAFRLRSFRVFVAGLGVVLECRASVLSCRF